MNYYPYYWGCYPNYDYRVYKKVTAYTVDRPVLVNGVDINVAPYQALNFQPAGAQYPFVYVPIAQFEKVGAQVAWDEPTQTLNVTTDYFKMQNQMKSLQKDLELLRNSKASFDFACPTGIGSVGTVEFSEVNAQYYKVKGMNHTFNGDLTNIFDVGIPYVSCSEDDAAMGTTHQRVHAKDSNGIWHQLFYITYHYNPELHKVVPTIQYPPGSTVGAE